MNNKFTSFFAIIFSGMILAGIYGILHDQLTYAISPEYYTKFKFYQFGLCKTGNEAIMPHPRLSVAIVGFLATWWMGIPISIILALVGLIHMDGKTMYRITIKAFLVTMLIAFFTGLFGLGFGWFFLSTQLRSDNDWWYVPSNINQFRNYIAVGSMHNFSYLGGLTGLIGGIIYTIRKRNKLLRA